MSLLCWPDAAATPATALATATAAPLQAFTVIWIFKKMYIIKAEGNGSCLFISMRLALEYLKVLKIAKESQSVANAILDGRDPKVCASAEGLRELVVLWYKEHLDVVVPGFGQYTQSTDTAKGREWVRGDILAIEMVRSNHDVPETGPERSAAMTKYLERMSRRGEWGSTPEYTAFAFMAKLTVEAYQLDLSGKLSVVDTVKPHLSLGTVKLLYSGRCHYDLLLDDDTAAEIYKAWPTAKMVKIN
jgi:hypothetical protein